MSEFIFPLTADPKEFFGENNRHIEILKANFPKLKIIARGSQIKAFGVKEDLEIFRRVCEKLTLCYEQKPSLSTAEFETLVLHKKDTEALWSPSKNELLYNVSGKPISIQNRGQQEFVRLVEQKDMVFALGPAGTGKTYISIAMAVKALKNKEVKRIILTRPAVESGENLGFLPGDIQEKLDPYMQPLYDALYDMIPPKKLEEYFEHRILEIVPLAFMRGRTLDNAFVILDEAQNTTAAQMKMFLTRMGKKAKFVITGDPEQIDLLGRNPSGLQEATQLLKDIRGVAILYFDERDVVRHPLVRHIIHAYKNSSHISR